MSYRAVFKCLNYTKTTDPIYAIPEALELKRWTGFGAVDASNCCNYCRTDEFAENYPEPN